MDRPARTQSRTGLARALSKLGYCSRAQAAELIRAGRVRLNGATRRDPETPVALGRDRIEVDGREIGPAAKTYWILNKPRGVVTTASDERGRETVYAYFPPDQPWLAPVGRLDKASEGLLLLTNDSAWAARITTPESHVDKTYHVQISAIADRNLLERLRRGVRVATGDILRVQSAEMLREGEKTSWVVIVLDEGKNRHIRRMFEAMGIEVLRLVRVAIGNLHLGDLPKGQCRQLAAEEVRCVISTDRRRDRG
ncbi:MAG TPA: pseudouridine synthase [Candidatus Acidoferrales bacterium]|nr:pseudouridine synthase [Candidatus Acidoferrales bacterium]